nr:immunoglobulin light chain junction region [Macaca mulatta]
GYYCSSYAASNNFIF